MDKFTDFTGLKNILFLTDSYKVTHFLQYPPNTTKIYSYFESRGGKFSETVFFGLQYVLKRWLIGSVVSHKDIDEAKEIFSRHFGRQVFNEAGWRYIVDHHGGKLPLRIRAVPEGMVVPTKNVLFTVENTDPKCFWLTGYFETILVQTWYPITVATISREQKRIIARYLSETADNLDDLPFKLNDFGYRGVSSVESAGIGGAAHLVNFQGTDNIAALLTAKHFYHEDMAGFSIPAAEHSTITSWGQHNELKAFQNMLDTFPTGSVAVVSDSYNIWDACTKYWGEELKNQVENRDGVLVIRPDSGKPAEIILRVLELLAEKFGCFVNSRGFKQLPPFLRVIQGDGISVDTLGPILEVLKQHGWSAANVSFGSGGAQLQQVHRDTQRCAYKCSFAVVDGKKVNVFKEPITDSKKNSKKGRLTLQRHPDATGTFFTCEEDSGDPTADVLVTVFEDGVLLREYSFEEIRRNAEIPELKQ